MSHAHSQKLSRSHYKIHTEIAIASSPDRVWSVLKDIASYPNWAAFLVAIDGEIANGRDITVSFQLNPKKPKRATVSHKIHVKDGAAFYWAEKGPGGICDNHHFIVEPQQDGTTRFVQSDEIMKGLTWLMGGRLAKMYVDGYQAFNESLKAEVERRFDAG